jgi:hypothetical protein
MVGTRERNTMIRSESILTRPLPAESGQAGSSVEGARKREENVNPFVAQQVVDVDAMRKQKRVRTVGPGQRYFLSAWCLVPALVLVAWCGLHTLLALKADDGREAMVAMGVGAGTLVGAFVLAFALAKIIDPGRLAASTAFAAVLMIATMASAVRLVTQQQHVASATPLTAWVMEPFVERRGNGANESRVTTGQTHGVGGMQDLTMDELAARMRAGIIDPRLVGKQPARGDDTSGIRMTVRKRKPVVNGDEVAEAKEGE